MKHPCYFSFFWEFQSVGFWSQDFVDFKWPFSFWHKFLVVRCFQIACVEPYFCPLTNGVNVFVFLAAICDRANSCAASASSLFLINCFIFSLIAGNFVCSNESGIAIGVSPWMSSNGVLVLSACRRLLCVNSKVLRVFAQFSGLEMQ